MCVNAPALSTHDSTAIVHEKESDCSKQDSNENSMPEANDLMQIKPTDKFTELIVTSPELHSNFVEPSVP